jgi:hypothetical protein
LRPELVAGQGLKSLKYLCVPTSNIRNIIPMSAEEKILTLHPEGKKGKNIFRRKYDITRECLSGIFAVHPEISHKELTRLSKERLSGKLEGNASWYMETVLLDLIAKGSIQKITAKPVKLKITKTGI